MKYFNYFSLAALFLVASLFATTAVAQSTDVRLRNDPPPTAVPTRNLERDVALERAIDDTLYKVATTKSGFRADNAAQHPSMEFLGTSTRVTIQGSALELRLLGHGVPTETKANGKRFERTYQDLREWFVNDAAGLEHGFVVEERPTKLTLRVAVDGGWKFRRRETSSPS